MPLRRLSYAMLAGSIPAAKLDLSTTFNFTGTLNKDGVAVANASQVGLVKVKAATTANISNIATGAPSALDGATLANNDRVLVKNQSTTTANGLYTVTSAGTGSNGVWTRDTSYDESAELPVGLAVVVQAGTVNAGRVYLLTAFAGTLGSDGLTWTRHDGSKETFQRHEVADAGSQTDYDLATASTDGHIVIVGGVPQPSSAYTVSAGGGTGGVDRITLSEAPGSGISVEIVYSSMSGA